MCCGRTFFSLLKIIHLPIIYVSMPHTVCIFCSDTIPLHVFSFFPPTSKTNSLTQQLQPRLLHVPQLEMKQEVGHKCWKCSTEACKGLTEDENKRVQNDWHDQEWDCVSKGEGIKNRRDTYLFPRSTSYCTAQKIEMIFYRLLSNFILILQKRCVEWVFSLEPGLCTGCWGLWFNSLACVLVRSLNKNTDSGTNLCLYYLHINMLCYIIAVFLHWPIVLGGDFFFCLLSFVLSVKSPLRDVEVFF